LVAGYPKEGLFQSNPGARRREKERVKMSWLDFLFGGKGKEDPLKKVLTLIKKHPNDPQAHRRLAEIYHKKGEKEKALSEYLKAAEIFAKGNLYAEAMAIYKQVSRQDPSLDHVFLNIANIYRQMGFLGDAFAQYRTLVNRYDQLGMKDKALEVMGLMAELDPRKMAPEEKVKNLQEIMKSGEVEGKEVEAPEVPIEDLSGEEKKKVLFDFKGQLEKEEPAGGFDLKEVATQERVYGFDDLLKELKETTGPSAVYPTFNYQMGIASREMGFLEDAVEQLQIAVREGQEPFEARKLLGLCYKEMSKWEEASRALEDALRVEKVSEEKKLQVQYDLGLIYKELGRTEEALQLLRTISAVGQRTPEGKQ
jgi:tetratricopeptide (TPR) repeat protein